VKVGDLVLYRPDYGSGDDYPALVVRHRLCDINTRKNSFLLYYPSHNDWINGWEDEYVVITRKENE